MTSIRWQALGIFLIGLLLFTVGSPMRSLSGMDTQFYLFALEMWQQDQPLKCLLMYQLSYFDYPPVSTLFIYGFSKIVNSLNTVTAVFPSAVASSITLATTYLIGALHSKRWGLAAVLFLLSTVIFFAEARNVSVDHYTTALATICFYLVYSAQTLNRPSRIKWIFLMFTIGFLLRGLSGFCIPTGIVLMYYLFEKEDKRFLQIFSLSLVMLVIYVILLSLFAHQWCGHEMTNKILRMDFFEKTPGYFLPFFTYLTDSFKVYLITYPLAILVVLGFYTDREVLPHAALIWKLTGWVVFVLLAFSLTSTVQMEKLLPMAPALALLCGYLFEAVHERSFLYVLRNLFVWFCFYFPITCLLAVVFIHHRIPDVPFAFNSCVALLLFLQAVLVLLRRRQKIVFLLAVMAFVGSYILVAEPIYSERSAMRQVSVNKTALPPAGAF